MNYYYLYKLNSNLKKKKKQKFISAFPDTWRDLINPMIKLIINAKLIFKF